MAFFDLSLDQLRSYLPPRDEPADFDAFWQQTLADARQSALDAAVSKLNSEPVDAPQSARPPLRGTESTN